MSEGSYHSVINDMLVEIMNEILHQEQNAIGEDLAAQLSIAELHVIEAVGDGEPHMMSQVAKRLRVTMPTLTGAVDRLVDKGLIVRERMSDRRKVGISLTEGGRQAFARHQDFHDRMVDAFLGGTPKKKLPELMESIKRLRDFFRAQCMCLL